MKKKLCLTAAALLLAGCETTAPLQQPPAAASSTGAKPAAQAPAKPSTVAAPPPAPELPPARKALNAGIELYKAGNFNGAIKQLSAPELADAETALQLEALKYTAFSYCVTNRTTLCRQQFAKAFKLDKTFDLSPGEKGHPLWTPSFERARKEAGIKK